MGKKSGSTVLCIGNDPVQLNRRCSLLRKHGWNVISSGSGHDGVVQFGQERVDAVILDLNDGGAELALIAGELKRLRSTIPIIMVLEEGASLVPGATVQADALVVKSEESRSLVDALGKVLKGG